ncbi:HAMP domain-containing histidine kinase [Pontibacter qinzhouensis]|uniref:histidine kinase n=1 Tax=Pontibacter qinzhouensis TaxID=2603253 RepID=A0A5C8K8I7_9BACT|nr:HAMP domain-containing sensor histidine kinase [Pontibacter qinzhouensis]TXK48136.1 HAMP domain-containing histidine kinase [Pontibacter qinzhouensis]
MRILTKTSLYYLLVSVVVFLAGSLLFYKQLQNEIYDEVDDQLFTDKENIIQYIRENNRLPSVTSGISEAILVREAQHADLVLEELGDTLIYSNYDEEYIPFRRLTFTAYQNNKPYQYTILKSLTDFQDLFESTFIAMAWIFLMLLLGLVSVNYIINRFTWRHFYDTLHKIKHYSLTKYTPLQLKHANTTEFQELNEVLLSMTDKIYNDYLNLKEFTENASHEIQTPLAIVNNKLELFMQADNLTQQQARMLEEMAGSVSRLARLNKSLILLTRIENQEFQEQERVPLHELLQEQLEQLQEMMDLIGLSLEPPVVLEPVWLVMNRGLAEVMVSNLLLNAIRHNHQGGTIGLQLTQRELKICNTGEALAAPPDQLMGRFVSSSRSSGSMGIGLALVKRICDLYHLRLRYTYNEHQHQLVVSFPAA